MSEKKFDPNWKPATPEKVAKMEKAGESIVNSDKEMKEASDAREKSFLALDLGSLGRHTVNAEIKQTDEELPDVYGNVGSRVTLEAVVDEPLKEGETFVAHKLIKVSRETYWSDDFITPEHPGGGFRQKTELWVDGKQVDESSLARDVYEKFEKVFSFQYLDARRRREEAGERQFLQEEAELEEKQKMDDVRKFLGKL